MPCVCRRGLEKWRATLRKLARDPKCLGIEKWVYLSAYTLKITSIVEWSLFCATGGSRDPEDGRRNVLIVDWCVIGKTIVVAALVWVPQEYLFFAAIVAGYLLFEMFVALFNVVLLAKKLDGRPISIERSLILLTLNAAQLIFSFAIFYQAALLVDPWRAVVFSFDVFGTVSRPASADYPGSDWWVILQIVLDFLFLAIVVANFFSLRSETDPNE